jgi:hypothetical protein
MSVALHFTVFDPIEAHRRKQPFEIKWSLETMSKAQGITTVKLLRVILDKLEKSVAERWPGTMKEIYGDQDERSIAR